MRKSPLALLGARPSTLPSPAALESMGRALEAKQIAAEFFGGRVTARWVLNHVARDKRVRMGRVVVWYEIDVNAWLRTYIAEQQATAARKVG
jgi:hypothetical protein